MAYETGLSLSQLLLFTGKKAFMAGINDKGHTGSLLIAGYPFTSEKPVEL